jgi:hypothetical protein
VSYKIQVNQTKKNTKVEFDHPVLAQTLVETLPTLEFNSSRQIRNLEPNVLHVGIGLQRVIGCAI